jgi:hypothetical protein
MFLKHLWGGRAVSDWQTWGCRDMPQLPKTRYPTVCARPSLTTEPTDNWASATTTRFTCHRLPQAWGPLSKKASIQAHMLGMLPVAQASAPAKTPRTSSTGTCKLPVRAMARPFRPQLGFEMLRPGMPCPEPWLICSTRHRRPCPNQIEDQIACVKRAGNSSREHFPHMIRPRVSTRNQSHFKH